jgi:hypothetical protein
MEIHILRTAVEDEGEKLSLAEMRKRMPPCPICGKKAYLDHTIADGFDFGYRTEITCDGAITHHGEPPIVTLNTVVG